MKIKCYPSDTVFDVNNIFFFVVFELKMKPELIGLLSKKSWYTKPEPISGSSHERS